ncbi:MAG: class I SAM-dependent methyltransferase [Acidobacteria bacterium]|nr:MAG: class I SAM-dependent methyltransferase [Acidobacteriota bacterium]
MDRLLAATAAVEDRHFWFLGLRRFAKLMLDRALPARRPLRILDCGTGTGRNLDWLGGYGWAVGVERSPTGLAAARAARRRVSAGDVTALPFPNGAFDLATSFDVIYSLDDDAEGRALREMHRVLAPGGLALVNAAALDILRGSHSALAQERRRYTSARLAAKLHDAGFDVVRMSYTNFLTLPITLAVRLAQRAAGQGHQAAETEMSVPVEPVNSILAGGLAAEAALMRLMPLPAGSSVMCVARKR